MSDNLANWIERREKLDVGDILRQITKLVEAIHLQNDVHGRLTPFTVILDSTNKNVDSINATTLDNLSEWRPTKGKEYVPSQAGDIFSLGCLFYFLLSGGQHPFGKSGQRAQLIENHLHDLSGCQNVQLRKLIARMIHYDCTKRPTCTEILNHPFLWASERISDYLKEKAENFEEDPKLKKLWTETILLSTKEQSVDTVNTKSASVVRSVAEILTQIKENEEPPLKLFKKFPDLLLNTFLSTDYEEQYNETTCCPEAINNMLIANENFGEVKPILSSIKRRHGRFGVNHVHVVELQKLDDTAALMKRIRQLTHQNLLQFFYIAENCSQTFMAFEPFNETLETWAKRIEKLNFDVVIEVLCQITNGLAYYHSNQLIHGNITADQVVIYDDGNSTTAKIAKFTFDGSTATLLDDVRKLGKIYEDALSRLEKNPMLFDTQHLISSMKNQNDEFVPPCDAIFYHPLFWDLEGIIDFILLTGNISEENLEIGNSLVTEMEYETSKTSENILDNLFQHTKSIPKTNRDLIQAISKEIKVAEMKEPELTEFVMSSIRLFPKFVNLTWLSLQAVKKVFCSSDIDSFYHQSYNFPTFEQLTVNLHKQFACNQIQTYGSVAVNTKRRDKNSQTVLASSKVGENIFQPLTTYLEKYYVSQETVIKYYLDDCIEKLHKTKNQLSITLPIDNSGRTVLHLASYSNSYYEFANTFIVEGANVNARDKSGHAPLHIATLTNSDQIALLLIRNHAIVDIYNNNQNMETPLYLAVANNSGLMCKLLLENKANAKYDYLGRTALHIAVASNSIEVVNYLLENGKIDVNVLDSTGNSTLCIAVDLNNVEMVKMLLSYNADPNKALHFAVANNSFQLTALLLDFNADPNQRDSQGETPLHIAALNSPTPDRLKVVDLLISKGANPNATDSFGQTVLHAATFNRAEDVVRRLLEYAKIEINSQDKERNITPLHLAAWCNCDIIVRMLIAKEANVNAEDKRGETPLEYAAAVDAISVTELLIKAGAKAESKRWKSRSPLHIAAAHGSLKVGKFLISEGADINATDDFNLTPLHYAMIQNKKNFARFLQSKQNSTNSSNKTSPPRSKKLCPDDMALIPKLTNGFVKPSIPVSFQLPVPKILSQFPNVINNFSITQEFVIHTVHFESL